MDASLLEYLRTLNIHPAVLALAPIFFGYAPKILNYYVSRRRREHETMVSKTYLEHLKLRLEIQKLAKEAVSEGVAIHLPDLPPLPEPTQPVLPLPERSWTERASWCFAGAFTASLPIYLIGALQPDGVVGFEEWGRLLYACTFIAVGAVVSFGLAFLPIRQRWTSATLGASAALLVWAFSGGYIRFFIYHI